MYIEAQMVFKSYAPLKLEKGMLFLISQGKDFQIRQLDVIPQDEQEYLKINGYPVEPYIMETGNPNLKEQVVLATPEQIGWFDEGEWSDELCDIELKHYNRILEGYDGWILIEMMETEEDEDELTPVIYNNKVTIAYADLEDEDDEDEDDPDEPNDDQIYNNFNHEGGIKY
jgi:hypothetical protein